MVCLRIAGASEEEIDVFPNPFHYTLYWVFRYRLLFIREIKIEAGMDTTHLGIIIAEMFNFKSYTWSVQIFIWILLPELDIFVQL